MNIKKITFRHLLLKYLSPDEICRLHKVQQKDNNNEDEAGAECKLNYSFKNIWFIQKCIIKTTAKEEKKTKENGSS